MNKSDINKRIYECLKEVYMLTHLPSDELLGGTPQNDNLPQFDPLEINSLESFEANPSNYKPREFGPEEVFLP